MAEHVGYIVKINELHPHSNADRLQIATIFGASVIVGLDVQIGDIGVYFPIDLQLSQEYCENNNLIRKLDENGKNIGGYLEPDKRNIRAMKLRGEKSEGLFMPLESLKYTGETKFEVGEKIEMLNGHEICRKYIPRGKKSAAVGKQGNKTRKHSVPIAPLFAEHADTEQLVYNMDAFKSGDQIEITLKMHGTSGRTGYLPKFQGYKNKNPFYQKFIDHGPPSEKATIANRLYQKAIATATPIYDWGYVTGTRRVVLDNFEDGGFYGNNAFREPHAKFFKGKLWKGETVYYEIVGFTTDGNPIMASVPNSKISDKNFTKQYGPTTIFSYGCNPNGWQIHPPKENDPDNVIGYVDETPQSDFYVYRMTFTTEDENIIEYTPAFMRYRCAQMGAKTVPVLWRGFIPDNIDNAGDFIKNIAEQYYDGPDPIGKTHIREGVVIRLVDKPKFCAYKHKNWWFKVLEGISKDIATAPDIEESQELLDENN